MWNDDFLKPPQFTSPYTEQLEQESLDVAVIVSEYYLKLKEQGLPIELINLLVVNFHNLIWNYSLVSKYK